jgi:alpha-1,3-rhamnosyl/mannosyltransferase
MTDGPTVALSVDALGPNLTGIGRYCLELAERLPAKLGPNRTRYFRGSDWIDDHRELLNDGWSPRRLHPLRRRLRDWRRRRELRAVVTHGPNFFLPAWAERGVATIHDLSVFLYPETHPVERVRDFERKFEATLRNARLLVTDTETVRQELISMFAVPPAKVVSVALGAQVRPACEDVVGLSALGLQSQQYFLCVSTFEPRKRIDRLVRAYIGLPAALRSRFPLVLAGAKGWHNESLDALIERASSDGSIRRLGFVSDALLQTLYAGATAFIYPSRYEGFGLPVVEAMAHGTPCIIADTPCLVEVARNAAKVVDPEDETAFRTVIDQAAEDHAWRKQARQQGEIVARSYSWDACATAMVDIYRKVAAE